MNLNRFKIAALVLFAAMIATNVNAQSVMYPKMHFGIRLGGAYSASTASGVTAEIGPTGGLALDFRVGSKPIYVETGAYIVDRAFTYKDDTRHHFVTGLAPVLLSYHFYISDKTAIQPFAGGFVSINDDSDFAPGARIGVGINYGRLYANVGFDKYFGDFDKTYGIFATIGFNFGGSR